MAERHVEARAGRGDLHIRRDHCLTTADRGTHRLAEHWVHARPAVLHVAVDTDESALAVGDGRPIEQLDEVGHETLAEHRSGFEQRSEIIDEASGEGLKITQPRAQPAASP